MNTLINTTIKSRIISIEGNIGSGKSRFLSFLKAKYKDNKDILFLNEPVDDWETIKDENGVTMLQKFYENPEKYSFSFQMMAYISRLSIMLKAIDTDVKFIITEKRIIIIKKKGSLCKVANLTSLRSASIMVSKSSFSRWVRVNSSSSRSLS